MMPSTQRTFVKTRSAESKVIQIFVFLGLLGGAWLLYHFGNLALLEVKLFIP
jgi:hypothetical protein